MITLNCEVDLSRVNLQSPHLLTLLAKILLARIQIDKTLQNETCQRTRIPQSFLPSLERFKRQTKLPHDTPVTGPTATSLQIKPLHFHSTKTMHEATHSNENCSLIIEKAFLASTDSESPKLP